ncbi:OLC1v1039069C1 [Oldenlandia corymbosa var. corymbosa]|uniref:OLC1v1039069C1 n=1 Tax=Oldenlandia corymbosa var. corymbosa TaxID=529605 RepID=A0AAV1D1A7_OLDCO|nr:OLC1v1039069C1 [Oldenlandia corymbosa var. corymbosa]
MAGAEAAALMATLEQATLMAKQLSNPPASINTNLEQSQILQIYSSLHAAHHHLSQFLTNHPSPLPLQLQPSFLHTPLIAPLARENSVSSAVGGGGDGNYAEPMQMGDEDDDDDVEYNSKDASSAVAAAAGIDGVEERMRDCYIQNKRPKRSLSPSVVAEQRRSYANEVAARVGGYSTEEFDPEGNKLRSLDLIYQFHG